MGSRGIEERMMESIRSAVYRAGGILYEGDAPFPMRASGIDGVFQPSTPNSILKYAASKGAINAALEVPVYKFSRDSRQLAELDKLKYHVSRIIGDSVVSL